MKSIPERLKAYMESNPLDTGDPGCTSVLDQLYRAYAESMKVTRRRFRTGSGNWKPFWSPFPCWTTMPYSSSAAGSALHMNTRHSCTACNMALS